eukprot:m.165452 g.165452  ORF g.165452 m.165452 type:complete len:336 (-) comp12563_c0_seq1:422-1429(-)
MGVDCTVCVTRRSLCVELRFNRGYQVVFTTLRLAVLANNHHESHNTIVEASVPRTIIFRSHIVECLDCQLLSLFDNVRLVQELAIRHANHITLFVTRFADLGPIPRARGTDGFRAGVGTVVNGNVVAGQVNVAPHLCHHDVVWEHGGDCGLIDALLVGGNVKLDAARWVRDIEHVQRDLCGFRVRCLNVRESVTKVVLLGSILGRITRLDGRAVRVVRAAGESAFDLAPLVGSVALDATLDAFVLIGVNIDGPQHVDVGAHVLRLSVDLPPVDFVIPRRKVGRRVARLGADTKHTPEVAVAHSVVLVVLVQHQPVVEVDLIKGDWVLVLIHDVRR